MKLGSILTAPTFIHNAAKLNAYHGGMKVHETMRRFWEEKGKTHERVSALWLLAIIPAFMIGLGIGKGFSVSRAPVSQAAPTIWLYPDEPVKKKPVKAEKVTPKHSKKKRHR